MNPNKRLYSLDILRGLTVTLMIFVNNGAGNDIFPLLTHSKWNGITLADFVFPTFLFIVGVTTWLSLRKFEFKWSGVVSRKLLNRTWKLFLIGLLLNYLDMALQGNPLDFGHLRIMGVMQRIALCYFFTSLIVLSCPHKWLPALVLLLLVGYTLVIYPTGWYYDAQTNILSISDRAVLGYSHMYHKSPVDPEGLLSTVSAIAQTLMGFCVAKALSKFKAIKSKMWLLLSTGVFLLVTGLLLTTLLPLNKRIWSPSFVLVTTAAACLLWTLLVLLLDHKEGLIAHKWMVPFDAMGLNPLVLYVVSEVVSILFGAFDINEAVFGVCNMLIPLASWASVAYAALFTLMHVALALVLKARNIIIKL